MTARGIIALALLASTCLRAETNAAVRPLLRAHAHNDYVHARPLLDALDHGFCSIEADVYVVEGQLLVAHDRNKVKPGGTLQALYLDPLRARVRENGGRVYPGGPEVTLLIDFKNSWQTTYPVLREILKKYADMLTTFRGNKRESRAIVIIISGNRSREMFNGEEIRYACLDGDLRDLDSSESAELIPWISSSWFGTFKWRGSESMPEEERARLKDIVLKTHAKGRKLRFWGAPDRPAFWRAMLDNGVDLINTDDLDGAQRFLLDQVSK